MMWTADDYRYMSQALKLAQQGLYSTSPNPRVGCVIVQQGQIIGQGAHLQAGQAHAEVNALRDAMQHHPDKIAGSTVYVTLEPCSHHGRTPPCAQALIEAKVGKVIAAMQDPNPLVAGQGLAQLQQVGIATAVGLLQDQAEALNMGFVKRMRHQRPWVRVKIAASLDGKTALSDGQSAWITSPEARLDVQHWRAQSCAILTGIGTVIHDNPRLNVRDISTPRQPLKVVVDSQLNMPTQAQILSSGSTLIAYAQDAQQRAQSLLNLACAEKSDAKTSAALSNDIALLPLANAQQQVDLPALMQHLAQMGINEVLVEAGSRLNGALLQAKLVDELIVYLAPHLMGGQAMEMFAAPILQNMDARVSLQWKDMRQVGRDLRLIARPQYHDAD